MAAVTPVTLLGTAAPARAAVTALTAPARATIGAGTVTVAVTIGVDAGADGRHRASVWYRYPGDPAATRVARLSTRRAGPVVVRARLDATRVAFGPNRLAVTDDSLDTAGAGATDAPAVTVDTRRRSRVAITRAEPVRDGIVVLTVRVTHYAPLKGRYVASRLSPVRLQEKVSGAWVTRATGTTSAAGVATATLTAPSGPHTYRAVRPNGATVWSATSPPVNTSPDQD
jgi:hypothetical protein